jgi:hypothetical protein
VDEPEKDQRLETELTYAWNWFQYHAGQRLTAFNFFLVIVGVVAVAFTKALEQGWTVLGAVVAGLGALISIGFLFLDVRNEEARGEVLACAATFARLPVSWTARRPPGRRVVAAS